MSEDKQKEISLEQLKLVVRDYSSYLLSKWFWIFLTSLLMGVGGVIYAWLKKPVYTAEVTFATETENSSQMGSFSGLAAQFGLDAGSKGGAFMGDNLMELFRSRRLIEKTLLTPVSINGTNKLLINHYLDISGSREKWKNDPLLNRISFDSVNTSPDRKRDSILKDISEQFAKEALQIDRVDKKLDIISAKMHDHNEYFAKVFIEQLVNNVIQYYVDYKSKKSRQNVEILNHQTDSIRRLLTGNIIDIAVTNDLNVNPLRQITRTNAQRKQVDVQANTAIYTELAKNLELSKIALRREIPFIQVIDTPSIPLDKKQPGRLLTGIIFAVIGLFLAITCFFFKKLLDL